MQRELALPRHDAELDGLREYAFKHAILHQVTYGTVLKRQRKLLHAKLADWPAAQSRSDNARAGDFLGLTAQHYEEAGDDANAAEFRARAAEHAAGRLAHASVLENVQKALALLDRAGESASQALLRWRLLRAREQTLEFQGERQRQAADLDAMDRFAEALSDDARRAYAAFRRAHRAMRLAEWGEAELSARHAVVLRDRALANQARSPGSADADDGLHEQRLLSVRLVGHAMLNQGRWDDAQALLQQTLDEARARGLLKPQAASVNSLATLADRRGERMRYLELARQSVNLSGLAGDRRLEAIAVWNVGGGLLRLGDLAAARGVLEEGLRLMRQHDDRTMECGPLCSLSVLALWQGDDARALALARSAADAAIAVHAQDLAIVSLLYLGAAEAALGRQEPAAQAYAEARRVAREIDYGWHFDASAGLARLALAQGDISGALQEVNSLLSPTQAGAAADAADEPVESDEPIFADAAAGNFDRAIAPRRVELTIHQVLAAAGDPRAAVWLQRAHSALMAQADAITDEAWRRMFLTNVPYHREIMALWAAQGAPR